MKPMLIPVIAALLTMSLPSAQPDLDIRVLREELANYKDSPFFRYDGSKLLLTLSDTEYDRRLAIWAIAQSDLRDIQHLDYLYQIHRLSVRGEDVTAAAFNILGTGNFRAFVAQHALMLGQDYALVAMLLPMEADTWVGEVIKQLEIETSPTAQRSQAVNRLPAAEIPPDSESELWSKRREVMKRVSDEALLELDQLALFLMAKRKVRPPG